MSRPDYPPLTPRHRRVFGVATLVAIGFSVGLALTRLAVIRWWLEKCVGADPTAECRWAEHAFTWWWVGLVIGILAIAWTAHRLTADRLVVE